MSLTLRVNGKDHLIAFDPETPLAYVIRDELKLKGTKLGCGLEQCGACAVLIDGKTELSCVSPAANFEGRDIVTVEGLSATETGRRVQAAFIQASAAQCGYCTAGLVVAVTGLLGRKGRPDPDETKAALNPHLCRRGSHPSVLRAVKIASGGTWASKPIHLCPTGLHCPTAGSWFGRARSISDSGYPLLSQESFNRNWRLRPN